MSGMDLYLELRDRCSVLDRALREYGRRGAKYAQAECDYRIALSSEYLRKRDEGMPVTIISDVCRGLPSLAKLRLQRDIAEVEYKAASEAINAFKLQIRILESQIEREHRG